MLKKGLYEIGGIRLRSNCTLYLEEGAILKGVRDIEAYNILANDTVEPIKEEYKTDVFWTPPHIRKTFDHMTKAGSRWNNALVKVYGGEGGILAEKVVGVQRLRHKVDEKFESENI